MCCIFSKILLCFCPLQRHFSVFAVNFPSADAQKSIFSQILCGYLKQKSFSASVENSASAVVQAAVKFHEKIVHNFQPTAIKFHYIFNLRDLSNIFQVGLRESVETEEWMWKGNCYHDPCYLGHPFLWAWDDERGHRPGLSVVARVQQSVLRQADRCHGPAALPEAPSGDCEWKLWGAM